MSRANISSVLFVPHPPLLIPAVGKGNEAEVSTTLAAMKKAIQAIMADNVETIVLMGPHGPVFKDGLAIFDCERLSGSMARFGAPEVRLEFTLDKDVSNIIADSFVTNGVPFALLTESECKKFNIVPEIDHSIFIPLYYLREAGFKGKIVYIPMGMISYDELFQVGSLTVDAIKNSTDRNISFIISGDLSHCLKRGAPSGYRPEGELFDRKVVAALALQEISILRNMTLDFVQSAAECGLRPIFFLLGILSKLSSTLEILSYEGPFGVGYCVSHYNVFDWKVCEDEETFAKKNESEPCQIAREGLRYYLSHRKIMPPPKKLSDDFKKRAGVFVCFKKAGQLRGCIGTFVGTKNNIAEEIIANAVSAGTKDSRFLPIAISEIDLLEITVDVLGEPEAVESIAMLDPKRYGVIVKKGNRSGTLLPDLDGIETVDQQVDIAMQKAGLAPHESDIEYYRYEIKRYK